MKRKHLLLLFSLVLLVLGLVSPALADTAAAYDLSWSTVDARWRDRPDRRRLYALGTAGQSDAGSLSSGEYDLAGGFWQALIAELRSFLPLIKR